MKITRHVVTVGARRVHYFRAGAGPAVAMLHACPVSAKVMLPLMRIFARRFTCLAFDMPGFGQSDPLPHESPSIEDFADGLRDTLDALGIRRVASYGRHTGASIAVEFAARHPDRCTMALADGYAVFSNPYTDEELDRYLEPIIPVWDGTHLLRLWFRYRDQHAFWPWNRQDDAHRSDTDIPDASSIHRSVIEMLEAGNGYRIGYRAPFRHRGLGVLADLKVPVCFGNRPGDSMYKTRPLYPAGIWAADIPRDFLAASEAEVELLSRHVSERPPPAPDCAPLPGRTTDRFIDIDGAQILIRSVGDLHGPQPPLLILHHAPGSSALYQSLMLELEALGQPCLALDMPGHGDSEPWPDNPQGPAVWANAAARTLQTLGIPKVRLLGHNGGAATALELANGYRDQVVSVLLDSPFFLDEAERALFATQPAPSIEPDPEGVHLIRAWHHLRDSELWWPWFRRERRYQSPRPSRIDPAGLTTRLREVIRQPRSYQPAWQAVIHYRWQARLDSCAQPLALLAAHDDLASQCCDAVAQAAGVSLTRCASPDKAVAIAAWLRT